LPVAASSLGEPLRGQLAQTMRRALRQSRLVAASAEPVVANKVRDALAPGRSASANVAVRQ
jgi:hypothetical protein